MNNKYVFFFILGISFFTLMLSLVENENIQLYNNDVSLTKYELSENAAPIIIVNMIIFSTVILYKKNIFSTNIQNYFSKIFHFEISKKISIIVIIFFITILFLINNNELYNDEPFVDFWKVEKRINDLKNDAVVDVRIGKYILLYISQEVFQSVRVVPLIASMSLMIITYLFTVQITQKRFAGLISMSLVLQSNLFLTYSSSSTYSNFWILFYLTSLYFVNKKWILSPITFSFSIFTKYLTPFYLPVSLYHIVKSELSKNKKILMLSGHLLVPIIGVGLHFTGIFAFPITELQPDLFITGFKDFSKFFVNDLLILVFLLPLTVALFVLSKKGLKEADTIMLMIFIVLLSAPILPGFFYALNNHAYRFVPLVIFFSIGIGLLFSNKVNLLEKSKSKNRKISYVIFIPTLTVVLISMLSVIFSNIIEGQYRLST